VAALPTGEARLAVRDHGPGIPPDQRDQIFDRFYQAHAHEHASGLGLGLHISHEIAGRHGGQLNVEFPADGGTCFVLTLPNGRERSAPARVEDQAGVLAERQDVGGGRQREHAEQDEQGVLVQNRAGDGDEGAHEARLGQLLHAALSAAERLTTGAGRTSSGDREYRGGQY
jgi:hypothetical protein